MYTAVGTLSQRYRAASHILWVSLVWDFTRWGSLSGDIFSSGEEFSCTCVPFTTEAKMRGSGSSQALIQKIVALLVVSVNAARPAAYASAAFPLRSADTSCACTRHSSSDGGTGSESALHAELSESAVHLDGATASPEGELWFAGDYLPTEPGVAADVPKDSPWGPPGPSDQPTDCCSRSSRDGKHKGQPSCFHSAEERSGGVHGSKEANCSSPASRRPWWRRLWSSVRGSYSLSSSSSTRYRTPFSLNRVVLLIAYTVSTILSSGCFFGWPSICSILFGQQAYSDVCPRFPNGTFAGDMRLNGTEYICNKQDARVQELYSLGYAVSCVVSVVGGIAYGRIGPRVGAVMGQLLNIAGWAMLGLESFFRAPAVAVTMLASALPLTAFPPHCVRHLFRGHEQAIIMILSAALSASVMMPLFVVKVAKSIGILHAVWGFIAVAILPSLGVAIFLIPRRDFSECTTFDVGGPDYGVSHGEHHVLPSAPNSEACLVDHTRQSRLQRTRSVLRHMLPWGVLISRSYVLLTMYRTVCALSIGYYFQSSARMLPSVVNNALGSLLISSPLFCLLFGLLSYFITPVGLMACSSAAGLLSYALPLLHSSDISGYVSALSFSTYLGTALPQTLAFLQAIVAVRDFTPLLGVLVMISGLLSTLSAPLYTQVTIELLKGKHVPVQTAFVVAHALQFLILFSMRPPQLRTTGKIALRQLPPTATTQDGDAEDIAVRQVAPTAVPHDEDADSGEDATE